MKSTHKTMRGTSYLAAFLMGVILFLSFGNHGLTLASMPVILGGLAGVALPVLLLRAGDLHRRSRRSGSRMDRRGDR